MNQQKDELITIVIFARAPVAGQAKTRLIASLGPESAADLQTEFIQRTLLTALATQLGPVSLWCDPDCTHPVFQQCKTVYDVSLNPQCEGDLGVRMLDAFSTLCPQQPVLLIGTDCPALTPTHLHEAATCLREGDDAVFFPAEDGGYVMIGLRQAAPSLFLDIPWGGPRVMEVTRDRLRQVGWLWSEPFLLWDVDRPTDLDRLRASRLMNAWFDESDYMNYLA